MLIGFVSDEYYAALPDVSIELRAANGKRFVTRSSASGAVMIDVPLESYEVCLAKPGFGSKRVPVEVKSGHIHQFRLLSDRMLGYAWPKWCRSGEKVQFRVHSVEPYKLLLYRYGLRRELVKNVGW